MLELTHKIKCTWDTELGLQIPGSGSGLVRVVPLLEYNFFPDLVVRMQTN